MIRDNPVELVVRHVEMGVVHAERFENAGAEKTIERFAAEAFDDRAEDVGRDAVVIARAGLEAQRDRGQPADEFVEIRAFPELRLGVRDLDRMFVDAAVGQAGGVRHQLLDRHLVRNRHDFAIAIHGLVGELGQVLRHRVAEVKRPLLVEHHRGHGRHRFGHREDAKQGIAVHRPVVVHAVLSCRLEVHDPSVPRDHRHDAGEPPCLDLAPRVLGDLLEARGGKADRFGCRVRQRLRDGDRRHEDQDKGKGTHTGTPSTVRHRRAL